MHTFHIYLKKGERLDLSFERFAINDKSGEIELYDDKGNQMGVLVRAHIAAIASASAFRKTERRDMYTFSVFIRKHINEPIILNAVGYTTEFPRYVFKVDDRALPEFF